jgi:hypothetical protein
MATELDVLRAIAARTRKEDRIPFDEYLNCFSNRSKSEVHAAAYHSENQNKKYQERLRTTPRMSHSALLTSAGDIHDAEPQRQQRGTGEGSKDWSWADLPWIIRELLKTEN